MKIKIKVEKEVEIKTLKVSAGARYWEDATVNGVEDTEGDLIPCRDGDYWKPLIDIDLGVITNWTKGTVANIHYKVCDDGVYDLLDENGTVVLSVDGYVPSILDLYRESYGDYIIMKVNEDGLISNWKSKPDISDFTDEDED